MDNRELQTEHCLSSSSSMDSEYQSDLCFPELGNISCRKHTSDGSPGFLFRFFLSVACVLSVLLNLLVIISISHFRHILHFCSEPRIGCLLLVAWKVYLITCCLRYQLFYVCVFLFCRQLYTPTNLLLLSLAISDVLVGLAGMPLIIIVSTSCWFFGHMACSLWNYLIFICQSASVGNMVLISADRFLGICYPLHYTVQVTVKKIQLCVCLCWTASVIHCGIILKDNFVHAEMYTACLGECVIGFDFIGGILDIIVNFLLPLSIIVTLNMRVFTVVVYQVRAARSHIKCVQLKHSAPFRAKKSELKAAKTLGVLVLVFLLCFCPFYIVVLLSYNVNVNSVLKYFYYLYNLNSFLNPWIYVAFYPWFRRAMKHIVTLHILQPGSCDTDILKTKRAHI
ncbi:trace amine-associated receptor 13c-like [Corythoichthys intestinalis]|uniref:trace amine-associated receptor 13c-like n=1 Tax=Corythoichthys intestinalis TaxID=161448 RepID=UPI0025A6681F|nr:trace amine-associated receptor 13c-like [Corythoichthys intestinalis]XP_057695353.1 trace amine-associated receptor 13c-like [Corythoichthys intestinalis]